MPDVELAGLDGLALLAQVSPGFAQSHERRWARYGSGLLNDEGLVLGTYADFMRYGRRVVSALSRVQVQAPDAALAIVKSLEATRAWLQPLARPVGLPAAAA
jgi:hypothetical protein